MANDVPRPVAASSPPSCVRTQPTANDTPPPVAALLTPAGAAAIAVIRIAGPNVADFLSRHFRGKPAVGRCVHGQLVDGDRVLDDPVVALRSNTSADLNCHGGPWVVQTVLDLCARSGFTVLPRPTPTNLADLSDGDALGRAVAGWIPFAPTELALRILLAQPAAWAKLHRDLAAADPAARASRLAEANADRALHHLLIPPTVALVGRANAGKSTLANQLFAAERSLTADLPGTTRDWVGEPANLDGLTVHLIDTPGLRDTTDPIERSAIAAAEIRIASADLVVLVLDAIRPLAGEQSELISRFPRALRVLNKIDLPGAPPAAELDGIPLSARTGAGVDALRSAIRRHFGCDGIDMNQAMAIPGMDQ